MGNKLARYMLCIIALTGVAGGAVGHGLMEDPPSRNWICGAITKPDEVLYGNPETPICGEAFASDFNGGYQFMSVLTHDRGRTAVRPLPEHVCGFASETFNGGATPWDAAIDWPTTKMSAGRQEFKWNIQWGPHFDDTEEFRYWITKPGFKFRAGTPLKWSDFESTEFCTLKYSDANPTGNPDVIPLKASTQFSTFCDVPARQGRHVIYGEWGRNQFTFERFHGCVDVTFDGNAPPPVDPVQAAIRLSPDVDAVIGASAIELDGSGSQGDNLDYAWSISAPDVSLYTIDGADRAKTTLQLAAPVVAQSLTISLTVSNDDDTSSASRTIVHEPQLVSAWIDLGPLTAAQQALAVGDQVSVRTVSDEGEDVFYPAAPVVLDAGNAGAAAWPLALARAVNAIADADIAIGVLDEGDEVNPVADGTANRVYAVNGSGLVSAFAIIERAPDPGPGPGGDCKFTVRGGANPWWAGADVAMDADTVVLDFTGTGLDLARNVRIDSGVFATRVSGQRITLTKPQWVSIDNAGYMGFNANNNPALTTFKAPSCRPE